MTTIYDVAQLAGVSPKTVSRVLNQHTTVKAETREAVEQAMLQLGYVPSSAARALRSQKSGLIGVITGVAADDAEYSDVRGLPDWFLIQGAQQVATEWGKTLLIADCANDACRLPTLMQQLHQYRAEGLLLVSEFHQAIRLPAQENCPIVLLNCFDPQKKLPAILPDDEQNQFLLTQRIIAQGHRRIAYITLPNYIMATQYRLRGYRAALAQASIAYDAQLVATGYTNRRNEIDDLWRALHTVLNVSPAPTVLCCGNDEMAMRVYGMLRTRGIKIPEDISVAGFDDHRQIAETLYPALTTVALPYVEMGRQAALQLIQPQLAGSLHTDMTQRLIGKVAWRDSVLPHDTAENV